MRKPRDASPGAGSQHPLPPASGNLARVRIVRVTAPVEDAQTINHIAAASFINAGFSVVEELSRPWARIWIALSDAHSDQPPAGGSTDAVGFLVSWHVADEVHILNVATSLEVRRRGIGTALMREAIEYAQSHHVRIVLLEVRRSNRSAIGLYRKMGFTAMGVRPNYYSDNGEDAVEMVLGMDPNTGELLPGRDEIRIDV